MKKLVLENGISFIGEAIGADVEVIAELVFNTSMAGYQEILSDPSYTDQMVVMTYPLIGNYGIIDEDYESKLIGASALIVKEYNDKPSNFRYTKTVSELLEENNIAGISGIDTRYLTRIIRSEGSMNAIICDASLSDDEALNKLEKHVPLNNQVEKVSSKKRWYSRCTNPKYNVVAIDCGIKHGIIDDLNNLRCNVTVVPYNVSYEEIVNINPDGVFLSNGPGNPSDRTEVIELVKLLQGKYPIFGICLGHQILALANGLNTYKLKFGHRGANHPVKDIRNGKIEITSQNHSYAVENTDSCGVEITHINILDNTVEGLSIKKDLAFSVQYHPESNPGPEDSKYLFNEFIKNMEDFNNAKKN